MCETQIPCAQVDECTTSGSSFTWEVASAFTGTSCEFRSLGPYSQPELLAQADDSQDCCDANTLLQQQNVKFSDQVAGLNVSKPSCTEFGNFDKAVNTSLGDYLSRPVEIATLTWTEGTNLDTDIFPWQAFFTKAAIKRKLDNYSLLRCELKIKVVVNASPFYYGLGLVSYRPMDGTYNPCVLHGGVGLERIEFMGRSQRPHIWIRPENNEGGEMTLPFLWHRQYFDATSSAGLANVGMLSFDSISTLMNANSVVGAGCTIQVYAWAENVQVAGPTLDLAAQAKDEYEDDGPISGPASAIASTADKVVDIIDATASATGGASLMFRPFATATSMISSTIGDVARLFGFTNVPMIGDIPAMKNQAFPMMATTSIGTPVDKLTIDPKCELSIDPRISGVDTGDELLVSSFVTRSSYIDEITWTAAQAPDDLLFSLPVTPWYVAEITAASQTHLQGTPMWAVAKAFNFWRGDIIFTFKIIASQYHRGRLRITWDPHSNIGATADNTVEDYQVIVDINKSKDIRLRVPWAQPVGFVKTNTTSSELWSTGAISNSLSAYNGTLTVRVLTEQTSPVASADVKIAVLVEGAENLAFYGPRDLDQDEILTPFIVQAADEPASAMDYVFGGRPTVDDPNLHLVYGGERVDSIRALMRRATLSRKQYYGTGATDTYFTFGRMNRRPLFPGYDPNGVEVAMDTIGVGTNNFNYCFNTYLNWFTACFVGSSGSVIWHLNVESDKAAGTVTIQRTSRTITRTDYTAASGTSNTNMDAFVWVYMANIINSGNAGLVLTNQHTQAGVSALVPQYSRQKFLSNDPYTRVQGDTEDDTYIDNLQVITERYDVNDDHFAHTFYVAAGTDYNCVYFLNVPTYYKLSSWPSPAP
jgi:hypothetical protein